MVAGVGILVGLLGYQLLYYGADVITGGNDSFVSLLWPGKYKVTTRDSGKP